MSTAWKSMLGTALVVAVLASVFFGRAPGGDSESFPSLLEMRAYFERLERGQGLAQPFPNWSVERREALDSGRVALGRMLFFDPVLSGDNTVSCAHCHHPKAAFTDRRVRAMGRGGVGTGVKRSGGVELERNVPTLWNVAFQRRFFWDGRAPSLEVQVVHPITASDEMAQDTTALIKELERIPEYARFFEGAFREEKGSAITFRNVRRAIAAFERTLVATNSRYDHYAQGDHKALSQLERTGLNVFRSLETRCFVCHRLPTFGSDELTEIGVPGLDRSGGLSGGNGYKRPTNGVKSPTLRNVALTAPYMHNGRYRTLSEVIDFYAYGGGRSLGVEVEVHPAVQPFFLTAHEKKGLIAFMKALTDTSNTPTIPDVVPSGLPVVRTDILGSIEASGEDVHPRKASSPTLDRGKSRQTTSDSHVVHPGSSIQHAVDAAHPGDTIYVEPGRYPETVTLDVSNLVLIGKQRGNRRAVLDGEGKRSEAIVGAAHGLNLRGFDIRGYTGSGVLIYPGKKIFLHDLRVEAGGVNPGQSGIYIRSVVGARITDIDVTGARKYGIYVGHSKDVVISTTRAVENSTGVVIENSIEVNLENNNVEKNGSGIHVVRAPEGPAHDSRNVTISNNRIHSNNRAKVKRTDAIHSMVPSGSGIVVVGADSVQIRSNRIHNNSSVGIAIVNHSTLGGRNSTALAPDYCRVQGNMLRGNGTGMIRKPTVDERGADVPWEPADLVWDGTGMMNGWKQPTVSRRPHTLPQPSWSRIRRLLHALTGH